MASETVASPMRIATAPGRPARPAPPGNNDPCGERRTIPEGLPRLPREALMMRSQTGGSDARRKARIRQRRARARARNPTWSAVKASVPVAWYAGRLDAGRDGCLGLRISIAATGDLWCATNARRALLLGLADRWGVRRPVMACRSGCVAGIQAPPALRTPLAKGQRETKDEANSE